MVCINRSLQIFKAVLHKFYLVHSIYHGIICSQYRLKASKFSYTFRNNFNSVEPKLSLCWYERESFDGFAY